MEYTELSAYQLHAGHVTTWLPTTTQEHWRIDPRPLSYNHESHVRQASIDAHHNTGCNTRHNNGLEDTATTRGDNWIGTAFRIHEKYDAAAVRETLGQWVARHEAYRTTAISDATGELHRETLPADAVGFSTHEIGEVVDADAVHTLLESHFASKVSTALWPHLTVATICPNSEDLRDPTDAATHPWFTVVFAADHAVMDAYTQIVSIAELREIYAAHIARRPAKLPFSGSHIDYSQIERDRADELTTDHPAVQRWHQFLCSNGGFPSLPRLMPIGEQLPEEGICLEESQQISRSVWLLDEADAATFGQISKRLGGSQMTGVLAALKLAVARTPGSGDGSGTFRYVMPMHTRNSPEFTLSAGWFVGLMPVEDPIPVGMTFTEAVPATTAAVKENRDLVSYPYPRIAELLGVDEPPRLVVSFVDTRFIPGAEAWTPHDRTLRGVSYSTTDVYIWIVRTATGLNISMRYPQDPDIHDIMRTLTAEYFTVLHSVADTGDASSLQCNAAHPRESVKKV